MGNLSCILVPTQYQVRGYNDVSTLVHYFTKRCGICNLHHHCIHSKSFFWPNFAHLSAPEPYLAEDSVKGPALLVRSVTAQECLTVYRSPVCTGSWAAVGRWCSDSKTEREHPNTRSVCLSVVSLSPFPCSLSI